MKTHIVSCIGIEIIKDPVTSILIQYVTYQVKDYPDKYVITAGILVQLPNIFEIEFEEYNINTILRLIVDNSNNISFKRYDMLCCPICDEYLHHYNSDHLLCVNIDCFANEDPIATARLKLMTLIPSVPVNNILQIINLMLERKLNVNVTSIIYFVSNMLVTNEHGLPTEMLAGFVDAVTNIKLDDLLRTAIGSLPIDEIDKIINYYDNSIFELIDDLSSVLSPLYQLGISDSVRILITAIVNSNYHIFNKYIDNILDH